MKKLLSLLLCIAVMTSLFLLPASAEGDPEFRAALCISNSLGDQGFFDSAYEGFQRLEKDFGITISIVECKSDASMYQLALVDAAENNDIVVAVGWEFGDGLAEVVPEMPDTLFLFIDNAMDGYDNLMSVTYAENEGSFLAGYIAMMQSQTKKVGFVGGGDDDTINNFLVGYRQGALYANPTGTVLSPKYANDNYEAPDLGKEAALSLYSEGADVVFHAAGKTGLGVFNAATETGNFAIGVDSDQKYLAPDAIICSMAKEVGGSIYGVISDYLIDGVFQGGEIWNADMSTDYIHITYGDDTMPQQVSPELKAEIKLLTEKIISGEIVVESTR